MINYPGKQEKLREELLKVVGKDRDVEESDRKDLPYLLAAINEIQRISSIINFNFFRRSTRETMCGKYTLPKGTAAGVIMSVIFQDDKNFPDSLKFEPERFLDGENGKHQQQMMIPFGVGKRMCMGEGLARAELYLIIGNLFKSYKVSMAEGEAPEEPVKRLSIFRRPKSFECLFQKVN
ncbi:hypothetical protein L596_024010 [Steinernema carpocapsae]|uniref:Cytochrome P450 n=1 Tax=Steinernema carpocapsae TaxID=34508 RepID=A0A4U5MFF0_STECR|nr:hypothetical protein L596_024010 [Steinernema carpocapsae]